MRYLIINADDYGLCPASNEGVERLFNADAITTTTLMPPAPFAEDGVRRARANPRMRVGLHLTTTCEYDNYRWGPIDTSCKSLMDASGYFYATAQESLSHATREDMEKELNAQYQWMVDRGLPPEHVDSHMATVYGLYGFSCMDIALGLCAKHSLHFRFPRLPETFSPRLPQSVQETAAQGVRLADQLGVGLPTGLFTYDYDVQPTDSYEAFRESYMEMVRLSPQGVSELFMHPCIETEQLKEINPQWKKRVWEYRVLTDPVFRNCIHAEGIRLTTYADAPFFTA